MSRERQIAVLKGISGFTVIEVLAALAVFGIVAAGLAANTMAVVRSNRVSNGLSVATTLAQDQIEQLRALDPDSNPAVLAAGTHADPNNPITVAGAPGGRYSRQWSVTRDSPVPGLSTVAVTVSWSDGPQRTVRVMAYVCQRSTCG
jgi:prepilin-type N-terminal cleavage/methylation domain-containing protein